MAKGIEITLYDASGSTYASGVDIAVMWFDSSVPPNLGLMKGNSAVATTTAGGILSLDLDPVTGLNIGDWGFLVCYKLDATDHRDSPVFASKMQVASHVGTTSLVPLSDFVRNPDWPAQVAMVDGVQKFTGLLAIYNHDSNYIALSASGDYTVNWGDGSGDIDVAAGVTAERNIAYADVSGTIVGTSNAVAVTFTDAGDLVTRTAHKYNNGQAVNFASIVTTTGITTHTTYYVINKTANTFQVSATLNGSAVTLTSDGTGTVYIPEYKVAVVTVTPQAANNITAFSLQERHSARTSLSSNAPWLDIAINSIYLSSLDIRYSAIVTLNDLIIASLGENIITDFSYCFSECYSLQYLPEFNTYLGTNFEAMFYACHSLQSIPVLNVSSGTSFIYFFDRCYKLQAIPLLDTSSGTDFSYMLHHCYSIQTIPLIDTSSGITFSYMFSDCMSLQEVPLLDVSSGTHFNYMFSECKSLKYVPALNTFSGTDFTSMFSLCSSLEEIGILNLASATTVYSMFSNCDSLTSIPALNTSSVQLFGYMVGYCSALSEFPYIDTSSGTNFAGMFYQCKSLKSVPLIDTSAGTDFTNMFLDCRSLTSIPLIDTSAGTNFTSMFNSCMSLQEIPVLNVSSVSISTNLNNMFLYCTSLSKARLAGTNQSIAYTNCRLSAAALDDIYTGLATVVGKTITVTGNPGVSGDDPTIATAKGWTVTG